MTDTEATRASSTEASTAEMPDTGDEIIKKAKVGEKIELPFRGKVAEEQAPPPLAAP